MEVGRHHATLSDDQKTALTAASTLALTNNDSTHTGSGSIDFSYSAADKSFDFLAQGETLAVTYDVTVSDEHNATSTQSVTVTITGTNDRRWSRRTVGADSNGAGLTHTGLSAATRHEHRQRREHSATRMST